MRPFRPRGSTSIITVRLKRDPVDDTPCGVDKTPFDGSSCWADRDTPVYPCGQCGIAYDVSYPTDVGLPPSAP